MHSWSDKALKGVFTKNERGYRFATNLTSICCVYKEKIVKKRLTPKNVASIQIRKDATFNSDRKQIDLIPDKSFRYYKQ